jgi:hypothetical protein
MTLLEFCDRHIVGVGYFAFFALAMVGIVAFWAVTRWGQKPTIRG